MSLHIVGQCGAALVLAAALAGCSSNRPDEPSRSSDCSWWRSCMYEGQYEPDEREYAEEEAARLNRQQSRRMGRD